MPKQQLHLFMAVALFSLFISSNVFAAASLCYASEDIEFSCKTAKGTASLCGSGNDTTRGLQYRFGNPGNIKFSYPPDPANYADIFESAILTYSGGGGAYITFTSKHFEYTVFSATGRWGRNGALTDAAGVAVKKDLKMVASFKCKNSPQSQLGPSLFKRFGLKSVDPTSEFEIPDVFLPK